MAVRDSTRDRAIVQPADKHTTRALVRICFGLQPDRSSVQDPVSLSSPRPIFLVAERLVQIWSCNEREFMELRATRLNAARARAYLASPGCNRLLGQACLKRLETQRQEHLARLRANRRAACEFWPNSVPETSGTRRAQSLLVLGSSRRRLEFGFASAFHAMLVRVAIRALPPRIARRRSIPTLALSPVKTTVFDPALPMPPYEVEHGRENCAVTTKQAGPAIVRPLARIPIVEPRIEPGPNRFGSQRDDRGYPERCNPRRPEAPLDAASKNWRHRYLPLARSLACRMEYLFPAAGDELQSVAFLALVEAAQSFDPSRGVNFATFARLRIWGALCDCRREMITKVRSIGGESGRS